MDVAGTAFALLAFDLYRRADATPRGRVQLALGLGAYLLAMLSKEPAALLPAILALYDLLCRGSWRTGLRPALLRWLPWFAVLGLYLGVRFVALGGLAPHVRPDLPGLAGSLLIAADLFARYVRMLFVPVGLSLGHFAVPPEGWASLRALVAIATVLATAAVAWLGWRRHRAVLFGLVVFVLTLAPALYLPGLRPLLSKLFGERFLYFPSVGWTIVVASALCLAAARAGRASRVAWLTAALSALVFAGLTVRQNLVWRSELTLWADAVAKYPADGMNYLHYGTALIASGERDAGRRVLDQGRVADPGIVAFHIEQGTGFLARGRPKDAILKFERALAFDPASLEAQLGSAQAYEAAGWNGMAVRRYQGLAAAWERKGDAARAAELRARAAALGAR
jgi:tetratricopeptide (TPR) repeat protein